MSTSVIHPGRSCGIVPVQGSDTIIVPICKKGFQPLGSPLRWALLLGRHFTDFLMQKIRCRLVRGNGNSFIFKKFDDLEEM